MPIRRSASSSAAACVHRGARGIVLGGTLLAGLLAAPAGARAQALETGAQGVPAGIVRALDDLFGGPHAGRRAVHAKGLLCEGSFTPAPGAASVSRARHLAGGAVPVLARFSNFAAVPGLPDGSPLSSPRGLAVKFLLPGGAETDLVTHSYDGSPAATPTEFLSFLRALPDPAALEAHAAAHPAARAFLDHPKPTPASYGTEAYFGVNALRFTDAAGRSRHGRYRIVPLAGLAHLDAADAAGRAPDFLADELADRLRQGPVRFRLLVQLAEAGDPVEDGSVAWPADRPAVELGTLSLHALVPDGDARQTEVTFVPTNLVGGIAPSADPMLLARTQAYRISADRRIAAP